MNFNKKDSVANAVDSVLQQEALKGGQKKLDKNHNNKLDAQDFKILRGEKKVSEEIDINDASEDNLDGQKKIKRKDDVGPAGNFKSSKVRFHAGPKNESLEQPLEKVLADTAPHSGIIKTVMATDNLDDTNKSTENKTKLKMKEGFTLKSFKEKYEEHSIYDQMIQEVLSKDASAGEWIHDFVHSDNPKFAGKSKEQRKKQALAAYYAKQRNEEVEQIDEKVLSTELQTVNGNHVVNSQTHQHPNAKYGVQSDTLVHKGTIETNSYGAKKKKFEVHNHPNRGLIFQTKHTDDEKQAIKKHLIKNGMAGKGTDIHEEVEQVEEASSVKVKTGKTDAVGNALAKQKMTSYFAQRRAENEKNKPKNEEVELEEGLGDTIKKGLKKAAEVLGGPDDKGQLKNLQKNMGLPQTGKKPTPQKEEVEQIDELTDAEVDKMYNDMMKSGGERLLKKHSAEVKKSKDIESGKALEKHIKKNPGVLKTYSNAVKRDKKMYGEEVEQVEEGWDDMLKAAKERHGPKPSGGSGVKQGSRYGGSKQKDEPEKDEKKK